MTNLTKAELFLFIKQRSARLFFLAIILVCALGVLYVTTLIENPLSPEQYFYSIYSNYYTISLLIIIFLVVLIFHDEYANKTIKNSIFHGFNRWKIMVAKCIALATILIMLLIILSFIMTIGALQINSTSDEIFLFIVHVLSSIPSLVVYCFLFESFLFMNKKVIVGLFLAYCVDQLIKLPLILLSIHNKYLSTLWKVMPSFALQNMTINHNLLLYLLVSFCIVALLLVLSKHILVNKDLPF